MPSAPSTASRSGKSSRTESSTGTASTCASPSRWTSSKARDSIVASATEPASTGEVTMRSGFLPDRIIHLHPTRLCNLACLHCYSESDPGQRTALEPAAIGSALEILRAEGYALVSLSGGEPLVYKPLRQVIDRAHE